MEIPAIIKSSVPKIFLKKKGDLATATDDGQLETLSVGSDGTVLTADSSQPTGFNWVTVAAASGAMKWGSITGTLSNQNDLNNALTGKEPANANIQDHIVATGNPHGTTKAEIGLGNVADEAQVKKIPASTDGNLVTWSGTTGDTVSDSGKKISDLASATHNHSGVYEPANANIETHITSTANPHSVTAAQVLPDQAAHNGKFLTTNGTTVSWGDPSAGTPPAGNGFRHVTAGAEDPAAKLVANADVDPAAAIAESKLSLNYDTHSDANDPAAGEKAALAGTAGTPGAGNLYVTDADPRNTNARPPTSHGSSAHTGTIGTASQVGLGNVTNDAQVKKILAAVDDNLVAWNGTSGDAVKDSGKKLSDLALASHNHNGVYESANANIQSHIAAMGNPHGTTKSDMGLGNVTNDQQLTVSQLDTDATLAANSDARLPSQKAVKSYAAANFAPIAQGVTGGDSHNHTSGSGATIPESGLSLADITTANASTARHGFMPKLPGGTTMFLRADGTFASPPDSSLPNGGTTGQILKKNSVTDGDAGWYDNVALPWRTVGDTGYPTLDAILAGTPAAGTTIMVPPGTHTLADDRTIPLGVTLKPLAGAVITADVKAIDGTLSCTWTSSGTGTLAFTNANTRVVATGSISSLKPGTRIKSAAGHYYTVRASDGATNLFIYEPAAETEAAAVYTYSTHVITGDVNTSFLTQVAIGDWLYLGGTYHVVSNIVDAHTLWVFERPKTDFSGLTATRSLRLIINGDLEAGQNRQCFSGNLAVKFANFCTAYPEWWGAIGDGDIAHSASNSLAIRKAIYSSVSLAYSGTKSGMGGRVCLNRGRYIIRDAIPITAGLRLIGASSSATNGIGTWFTADWLNFSDHAMVKDAKGCMISGGANKNYGWEISDFMLESGPVQFGNTSIDNVNIGGPSTGIGVIHNLETYNSKGWGIKIENGAGDSIVRNCHIRSRHGISNAVDSFIINNEVEFGQEIMNLATITSTGWTVASGTYSHVIGQTTPLQLAFDPPDFKELEPLVLKCTITYNAGDLSSIKYGANGPSPLILFGGALYNYPGTNVYYFLILPSDISDNVITFNPLSTFDGSISGLKIYSGVGILDCGGGNVVEQNIAFGDGSGAVALWEDRGTANTVSGNRLGPAAFGVMSGGVGTGTPNIHNNLIGSNMCVGVVFKSTYPSSFEVENNQIVSNAIAAFGGPCSVGSDKAFNLNGGVVKNNRIKDNGAILATAGMAATVTVKGLMENNYGIDLMADYPILKANSATPDIQLGKRWKTANTIATSITDFLNGCKGKEVIIVINDTYTTFNFATGNLRGNASVNYLAKVGDSLLATQGDDGKWYCTINHGS